ncbi:restriction endonuclease subunit S [Gramella jeungdoensis]|uniref:Restriction endonuclease subunit S n=1 Tax=Gramella jeungdoensis TaxID=708091 RepID=A0ABT0Z140_9FLAO|nr:restriction endonuclease subunit S [Gramella jeungdoensis]MCM8568887.1 restriction endonuclease subunit S [Gramella jeungdoensis]
MKTIEVKSDWLSESGLRLDASFHLSDGPLTKLKLRQSPYKVSKLSLETKDIFKGNIFKRVYVTSEEYGLPYLTASDMMKTDIASGKFISRKYTDKANLMLEKNWILVSRSGTIGNTIYTNEEFENVIGTDDLIRIIPNNKSIKSGFLYAYLSSNYGYGLLTQSGYGGVVKHIEPHHLNELPIPILPNSLQTKIHDLIVEAADLRSNANKLLREAKEEFYSNCQISKEEVNSLNFPLERDISLSHQVNIKDISKHTFRGRNYSIRKKKIISLLSRIKHDTLRDVIEKPLERGGRFKRVKVSEKSINAVNLLNQGDIFDLNPKGKLISKKAIKNWADEKTKKNLILIPALGTLGENEIFSRVQFCYGYLENQTVAEGLMRIVPDEKLIDPGYLFTVLSSDLWFRMLRNSVHGTNLLGYIYPMLHGYPIPRIGKHEEEIIGAKVRQAYTNFTRALSLESKSINMMENEIESWQKS